MTYNSLIKRKPIVVVELRTFINASKLIWTESEREDLVDYVARNPDIGDIIPGTGGVRKLRWSRAGAGKRGGARVVYFYNHANAPIYMLLAYAKAMSTDMTPQQKMQVAKLTTILKIQHSIKED